MGKLVRLFQPHRSLARLEKRLQHPSTYRRPSRPVYRVLSLLALVIASLWAFLVILPNLNLVVPFVLAGLPPQVQLAGIGTLVLIIGPGLGYVIYHLFRNTFHRYNFADKLQQIQPNRKMAVNISGSGALGFIDALKGSVGFSDSLVVFAHPPLADMKTGSIRFSGATIACAPANDAIGTIDGALGARTEEGIGYLEAYKDFMETIGGDQVRTEWNIFHQGEGHTSETAQIVWAPERTATLVGADPGRFNILVRDAGPQRGEGDHEDPSQEHCSPTDPTASSRRF